MSESSPTEQPIEEPLPAAVGHEPSNASPLGAAAAAGGALMLVLIAMLVCWMIVSASAPVNLQLGEPEMAPPRMNEPPLDPQEPVALSRLREHEAKVLENYGWVDQEHQLARIPIERAIQLVAENGLPQWPTAETETEQTKSP